ncbi:hypothetical protein HD806DRAFT_184132 [Xylariaceae sp. AK1471]|nr:hypothetical protein HD806DRAFT_184132 [Xylariaceae sp. AK1471]
MKFLVAIFASLAIGAAIDGLPKGMSVRSLLPANYTIKPITWTGPIVPGGENYSFQGTVQEVFAQANAIRAKLGFPLEPHPTSNTNTTVFSRNEDSLTARQWDKDICNVGLPGSAAAHIIDDGIKFVSKSTADCSLGAGPGTCGRISCSYNAAIYWCNDNNHQASWKCHDFATFAKSVRNHCTWTDEQLSLEVWGQSFDIQNFNVMVGKDTC